MTRPNMMNEFSSFIYCKTTAEGSKTCGACTNPKSYLKNTANQTANAFVAEKNTNVTPAHATVTSAMAGVTSAMASVTSAMAGVTSAMASVTSAMTGVTSAMTGVTSAMTGVTSAMTGVTSAMASVTSAMTGVTSAMASVTSAMASVTSAMASVTVVFLSNIKAKNRGNLRKVIATKLFTYLHNAIANMCFINKNTSCTLNAMPLHLYYASTNNTFRNILKQL